MSARSPRTLFSLIGAGLALAAAIFALYRLRFGAEALSQGTVPAATAIATLPDDGSEASPAGQGPEAPAPDRQPAAAGVLWGRLLDPAGAPISGAVLSWTALDPARTPPHVQLFRDDGVTLRAISQQVETDESGDFEFTEPPPLARENPSVVWITHPGIRSEAIILEPGTEGWQWPTSIAWTKTDPVVVHAVDMDGRPLAGATVLEFLMAAAGVRQPTERGQRARKFFVRIRTTDAGGAVTMGLSEGMRMLVGVQEGLRSQPLWPTGPGEQTLVLRATFELSGAVDLPDPGIDLQSAYMAVYAADGSGDATHFQALLPRILLRADGGFGPVICPVPATTRLHLVAKGGPLLDSHEEIDAPVAGQRVFVRITGLEGAPVEFAVRDRDGKPVPAAWVGVSMDPQTNAEKSVAGSTTDEGGIVRLAVPRTNPFRASAGKQGFAWVDSETLHWSEKLERVELTLLPACKLVGRVVCRAKPVRHFELSYWRDDAYRSISAVFDSEEGRFEVADLAPGRVFFFVAPPDLPQSEAHDTVLRPDGADEIVIELPEPSDMQGRVVDAATREPVPDAFVTLFSSQAKQVLFPRGAPIPVDSSGGFTLHGVGPEGDALSVEAKGYATTYKLVHMEGGKAEFSVVSLQPNSSASVLLLLDAGDSPERYVLSCEVGFALPATPFPPSGELLFEGLPPNAGILTLLGPGGRRREQELAVPVGARAKVVFDLRGGHDVKLRFEPESAAEAFRGGRLRIHGRDTRAHATLEFQPIPVEGEIVARGLASGSCTIELLTRSGAVLGHAVVDLSSTGPAEALVRMDARLVRLRVLGHDREPISGARVELCAEPKQPAWEAQAQSDSEGLVQFDRVPLQRALVCLRHGSAGSAYGIPLDLARGDAEPIDVLLDAREQIRIQVFDGGKPRGGVRFTIRPPESSAWSSFLMSSNAEGLAESGILGEGDYPVLVSSAGLWPTQHLVHLPQKQSPERIDLVPRTELKFTAVDAYDEPMPGVRFELAGVDVAGDSSIWMSEMLIGASSPQLVTDSDGELVIHDLPACELRWRASGPENKRTEGSVHLAARTLNRIEAKLH